MCGASCCPGPPSSASPHQSICSNCCAIGCNTIASCEPRRWDNFRVEPNTAANTWTLQLKPVRSVWNMTLTCTCVGPYLTLRCHGLMAAYISDHTPKHTQVCNKKPVCAKQLGPYTQAHTGVHELVYSKLPRDHATTSPDAWLLRLTAHPTAGIQTCVATLSCSM